MSKKIDDPDLYRELNKPFKDREEAAKAADAFFEDLREIRKKHLLPDVTALIHLHYLEGGSEHAVMFTTHNGGSANALLMLAQAFGAAKRDHIKLMELLAASGE